MTIISNKDLFRIRNEILQFKNDKFSLMYDAVKARLDKTLESYEHDVSVISNKLTRRYINRL